MKKPTPTAIERMIQLRQQDMNQRAIAKKLNEEGFRLDSGREFTQSDISRQLIKLGRRTIARSRKRAATGPRRSNMRTYNEMREKIAMSFIQGDISNVPFEARVALASTLLKELKA